MLTKIGTGLALIATALVFVATLPSWWATVPGALLAYLIFDMSKNYLKER